MTGKLPERRSYLSCGVYKDYLYVFGGQDLKEGSYNTMWKLSLKIVLDGGTTGWELVNTSGQVPAPISHHNGLINGDSFYVYGGMQAGETNEDLYMLNLKTMKWQILGLKDAGAKPPARDDHSACFDQANGSMFIFGGYVRGGKANDLWKFDIQSQTWENLDKGDYEDQDKQAFSDRPSPRVGASLTYMNDVLYLFGGHDENNEKLNDFWKYQEASS